MMNEGVPTEALVSKAAFARSIDYSRARITQLTKPGEALFSALVGKKIDPTKGRALMANIDAGVTNAKNEAVPEMGTEPRDAVDETEETSGRTVTELRAERLVLENARLKRRAEIECGELVSGEVVKAQLQDRLTTMFDGLRMSPRTFVDKLIKDELLDPVNDNAALLALQEVIEVVIEDASQIVVKPDA